MSGVGERLRDVTHRRSTEPITEPITVTGTMRARRLMRASTRSGRHGYAILGPMVSQPFADTPEPPYVAVIFTSARTDGDHGYAAMTASMEALATEQPGFLGIESARDGIGITVSYWTNQEAARGWKHVAAHLVAQRRGREVWYEDYRVRIATVDREYSMRSSSIDRDL